MGGILGTVITGLVLWWLTGPLSPFVNKTESSTKASSADYTSSGKRVDPVRGTQGKDEEPPVEKKAEVLISGFNLKTPINIGTSTTCDFEVTNRGNENANGCQLIWETPGLNGNKTSESFNLAPGEKKSFQLSSNVFDKEGKYDLKAHLSCSNANQVEDTRPLVVNFMMQLHPRQ